MRVTIKRRADINGMRGYVVRVDGQVVGYAVMRRHYHYVFRPTASYKDLLYPVAARRIRDLRVRITGMWYTAQWNRREEETVKEDVPHYGEAVPKRVRQVLLALRAKTVARGCTPAEEAAARTKVVELETKYGVAA